MTGAAHLCRRKARNMKRYKIGYTQGVYDMFHIGHLNLLHQASEQCDSLIVGVNSDQLVYQYKHKRPVVNEHNRMAIVSELRCVEKVVLCNTLSKTDAWQKLHFDAVFIGNDWKGDERWIQTERDLKPLGAEVVYLQHTDGVSSSLLREKESNKILD
jgi:glycerol-3-phosphate cytidylyltransferase